jgi:hypothetical protein
MGLGRPVAGGVVQFHVIAARGHRLGDTRTHLARADDGD